MRRRGFTLLEIVIVLGLIALAALVAMRLFNTTLRIWKQSADEQANQTRFDQAIGQLRRDVWSATSMKTSDFNTLQLHDSSGDIRWKAAATDQLSRAGDRLGDDRHWRGLGSLQFEVRGPMLIVRLAPTHEEAGGQVTLMSQSMLLAGRSR